MSYNKEQLEQKVWENPTPATGLHFTQRGNQWESNQRPDGVLPEENQGKVRTTLKLYKGKPYLHYNGVECSFLGGDIWEFVKHFKTGGNDFLEALTYVAECYGVEPDYSGYTKEQRQRAEQRRNEAKLLQTTAGYLRAALNTPQGEDTKRYLTEVRHLQASYRLGAWSNDIKEGLICELQARHAVTKAAAEQFIDRFFTWQGSRYADDYKLAIPYTNGERVAGICLRRTTENIYYTDKNGEQREKPKYLYSSDMPKGGYCEKLQGGYSNPVFLVEGLLDAERLKQSGFSNVLAMGGTTPTDNTEDANKSQIQTLQRYGAKSLYYVADCEYYTEKDEANGAGKAGERKKQATEQAIGHLRPYLNNTLRQGFSGLFIVDLETSASRQNKTKEDADTFLQTHTPADFEARAEAAAQGASWFNWLLARAVEESSSDAELQDRATKIYLTISNYADRQLLQTAITQTKEGEGWQAQLKRVGLTAETLKAIDREGERSTEAAQMKELKKAFANAETRESYEKILTKAQRVLRQGEYRRFEAQLNATPEQLREQVRRKPDTLNTGWKLYKHDRDDNAYSPRQITFTAAAVSIVAAPTNCGKTLFLLEVAAKAVKTTHKRVIYISLENDQEQLYIRALSAYLTNRLSEKIENPRGEIRNRIKGDFPEGDLFTEPTDNITKGIRDYDRNIHPYLKLIRGSADIEELYNVITAQIEAWNNEGIECAAVFVDYLQLLHAPSLYTHSRTDEVKAICDRLNDLAKATALPIVLAAQFNRQAVQGGDINNVTLANIGESAGIENIAEDCYLVWLVDKITQEQKEDRDKDTRLNRCYCGGELRRGYLYVENLKARDYASGGYCLLECNTASGAITSAESIHKDNKNRR